MVRRVKPWAERLYNSKAWQDCRDGYLQSVGHLCERCMSKGDVVAAKIVHHIKHLTMENIGDPSVALSWDNLEALCQDCHNKEHHSAEENEMRYGFDDEGNVIQLRGIPPMRSVRT